MEAATAGASRGRPMPSRSLKQRLDALAKANGVRTRKAVKKARVKSGELALTAVLEDPDFASAQVRDVVLLVPGIGKGKAASILRQLTFSPSMPVGGMSPRRREQLVDEVRYKLPPRYRDVL